MKRGMLLSAGAGIAAMVALPGHSRNPTLSPLENACRASQAPVPDSCPCTITKARDAGLSDSDLASLFKDGGPSQPLAQAQYSAFWQAKSQCIADAMRAQRGASSPTPLAGGPKPMQATPAGPLTASPTAGANKKADAPVPPEMLSRDYSAKRTLADIDAMIAQLKDTAWEYTEADGRFHRYDFLPDGDIVVYQTRDAGANVPRLVQVDRLSAGKARYGAFIRARNVTTGRIGDLPINSLSQSVLNYQKRYVRTGEEWLFRKVGPARSTLPDGAPKKLEDGFWKVPFMPVSKTPLIVRQNGLQGAAGPEKSTLSAAAIAGARTAGFLIGDTNQEDCQSRCFFIVNDFDQGRRRVRRRLIDEAGVAYVGARPEPMLGSSKRGEANVMSLRAYDGNGGWKEWRCSSQRGILDCAPTGSKAAPQPRQRRSP